MMSGSGQNRSVLFVLPYMFTLGHASDFPVVRRRTQGWIAQIRGSFRASPMWPQSVLL